MSNIEVYVMRGQILLVTPADTQFHSHSKSEAHDLVTRILSAVANVNGIEEAERDRAPRGICGKCNNTKGPRHRCVPLKGKK